MGIFDSLFPIAITDWELWEGADNKWHCGVMGLQHYCWYGSDAND
jgi:hypothetical protein